MAFFVISTLIFGTRFSFGIFFKSIESEFDLTRTVTSGIFSVNMVLGCVFAILGGLASDRYGPRIVLFLMGLLTGLSLLLTSQTNSMWQLFITYSLLLAMGSSAMFVVMMSTVSRWFDKKRGLALGIASSGVGLGIMVMAPFATFLISNFDWRMAFIIIGVITWLIVFPLSRLLKKDPYEIGALPDGLDSFSKDIKNKEESIQPADFSLLQTLRTKTFWLITFVWLFLASNMFLVFTHLVPHVTDIGFSAGEAAAVLSLVGGLSVVGRVLMGTVSDRIGRKPTAIICALLQAGAMVWLTWSQDLWMLYLFALFYGLAYGGIGPSIAALIGDTFGLRSMGAILGALDIGFGVGGALGSAIGGLIFDATNSYFMAFLLGAVVMFISALLIAVIRREKS
ncbi:unnamed protein product [marine sediment metagenome]|uniref:Major facilitator superfamily (MFS) profile domain-containing protein n=1 Tax=marine sediment metagenome TaxID=412755 RepID=X1LXG8_9ZZZZ